MAHQTAGIDEAVRRETRGPDDDQPHPTDIYVGARVRLRRNLMGMSQGKLASGLGITFQQVQKYERGDNRISASRLWDLARILEVPVSYFFEGIEGTPPPDEEAKSPLVDRETARLVSAFGSVSSVEIRKKILQLLESVAQEPRD